MSFWNASLFFPIHALPLTKGQYVYVFKEKDAVCVVSLLVFHSQGVSGTLLRDRRLNANEDDPRGITGLGAFWTKGERRFT